MCFYWVEEPVMSFCGQIYHCHPLVEYVSVIDVVRNFSIWFTRMFFFSVKYIDDNKVRVVEGQLRCKELSEYLDKMQTVRSVWISEDATAIVSIVKYDPKTNQLIGILLPLNKSDGLPKTFSFEASNATIIEQHLKQPFSKFVHVVMAQPLDEKVPPFLLQMFSTNNNFTAVDVVHRWNTTKLELERWLFCHFIG